MKISKQKELQIRAKKNIINPETLLNPKLLKPRGQKHINLMQKQVVQLQGKIADLKSKKLDKEITTLSNHNKKETEAQKVVFAEVLVEKIIEREVVEEVEVQVEREVIVEEPQIVHRTIQVQKEVPKQIIVPRIMVRPRGPPKEIIVEVEELKQVVIEVMEPLDQRLIDELTQVQRKKQRLERQYQSNKYLIDQLTKELMMLQEVVN